VTSLIKRKTWAFFSAVGLLLVLALVLSLLAREALLGFVAETYLDRLGISSAITVTRLEPSGLSANLRLSKGDSVITVERVDLGFGKLGLKPEISSVLIERPDLRIEYNQVGLSLGLLQHVMDILPQNSPQQPLRPIPVIVEGATVTLETPAGSLVFNSNAEFFGRELMRLDVSAGAATLTFGSTTARIKEMLLHASRTERDLMVSAKVNGDASLHAGWGEASADTFEATVEAPLVQIRRTNGHLQVKAEGAKITAKAETLRIFSASLPGVQVDISLANGTYSATPEGPSLSGQTAIVLSTNGGDVSGIAVRKIAADLSGSTRFGDQRDLDLSISAKLDSGLAPRLVVPLLEGLKPLTPSDRRAVKENLEAITVDIPSLKVSGDWDGISLKLGKPATVAGALDMRAVVSVPPEDLFVGLRDGAAYGALNVSLRGSPLPAIDLAMSSYRFARLPDVSLTTELDLGLSGRIGGVRGAALKTAGQFRMQGSDMSYALSACSYIAATSVSADNEIVVRDAAAVVCPRGDKNILRRTEGAWHFSADWSQAKAIMAEAGVRIADVEGTFDIVVGSDRTPSGDISVRNMLLADAGLLPRFAPTRTSGSAQLRRERWTAKLSVASPAHERSIGSINVDYAPAASRGEARFDLHNLAFQPGGLQPADLLPQLAAFESASGNVGVSGLISWGANSMASEGALTLDHLDFNTPAGMIKGLSGTVRFSSLLPLVSLPDQKLEISEVYWMVPITGAGVEFSLDSSKVQVNAATAQMAGGIVSLDPFAINIGSAAALQSTVRLQDVDLGQLMEHTNFADRVQFAIKVKGAVPFSYGPTGLRFQHGSLGSIGPGRLSISRGLWTGPGTAPVNAVQDFAYQAMEYLAVDDLTGEINSQDDNRLGIVLRIKGRHDPMKPELARLKLFSLLKGDAFSEPLPLPAQTPVDLTLDVSLNFGELARAYGDAFAQVRKRSQ
jgi:hypothetical protein